MDMPQNAFPFFLLERFGNDGWVGCVPTLYSIGFICRTVARLPSVAQSAKAALQGALDPAGVASQARELWWEASLTHIDVELAK